MRPWSSRSPISPRMRSACSSMTRKNCSSSAVSGTGAAPSTVAVEPLMEISGVRSSWLTMARNPSRCRSSSSSGARSCRVTTTDSTSPSAARIGVELTSVRTPWPSGSDSTISSARTLSPLLSCRAIGISASDTSRPSARRHVTTPSSSSMGPSELRRPSTIRRASRLIETGCPVRASKTTTPTGEVSTRASRPARARRSSRWARALAIALAAWEANSTKTSSSPEVNSRPPSFWPRKKLPTWMSRCRMGAPCRVREGISSADKPSART